MPRKKYTDEQRKRIHAEANKKAYWQNRSFHLERQYYYRYVRGSVQKLVDDNWSALRTMTKEEQNTWAIQHGFGDTLGPRKWICFWKAISKNKSEGMKAVKQRVKEMAQFAETMQKNKIKTIWIWK